MIHELERIDTHLRSKSPKISDFFHIKNDPIVIVGVRNYDFSKIAIESSTDSAPHHRIS